MLKSSLLIALLTLPLSTAGCDPHEFAPRAVPQDPHSGTAEDCAAACKNGRKLACVFAENTPEGGTCEAVCLNSETSGYASMNPACMAQAKSCEQADDCANQ